MFTGEIKRARSKRPLYIGLGFVVLLVALVLVIPMPHNVPSTFVLAPISTVELNAPRDGTIGEVTSATGSTVGKGAVIAKYDVADAEKRAPELEQHLAAIEKQAAVKPNPKARAAVTRAEGALKAAVVVFDKATAAAKGKKTPALAAAEKKKTQATDALEKAKTSVGMTKEEAAKLLASTKEALDAVKAQIAAASILAPASGVLTLIEVEKGKAVTKDAKIAIVEDTSKLKAMVKVPAKEVVVKGQGVELSLPTAKKRVLFDADAKGDVAEAEFDNAKGEFSVGMHGEANIEGTQRSIVSR